MHAKKCSLWNKQSLCLSFCLVSVCLLPSTVEGMVLGDFRAQNAPHNSYKPQEISAQDPRSSFFNDQNTDNAYGQYEKNTFQDANVNDQSSAPERTYRGYGGTFTEETNTQTDANATPITPSGWYGKANQTNDWATGTPEDTADNQYVTADRFENRFSMQEASRTGEVYADQNATAWNQPVPLAENDLTWDDHRSQEYAWDDSLGHASGYASTACCEPREQCCWGNFKVFADFLYWNVCQDNLDYAAHVSNPGGLAFSSSGQLDQNAISSAWFTGNYHIKSVSSKYKPGFRVGGFYSSPCCSSWDFGLVYTRLHSHYNNRTAAKCDTNIVLPTQLPNLVDAAELLFRNNLAGNSPVASSKLQLHYDVVDILASTSYNNGGCVTWQPYFGARFLEIKERWNVEYAFNANQSSLPVVDVIATSKWNSKIPAVGFTAGVNGSFAFCNCWSVIGRLGASCVGGRVKQNARLDGTFTLATSSSSTAITPARITKNKCSVLTGFEGAIGIGYTLQLCTCGIQFAAGYEFQNWYNVPSPIEHGIVVPGIKRNCSTDLSLHGLFVRAGVSF